MMWYMLLYKVDMLEYVSNVQTSNAVMTVVMMCISYSLRFSLAGVLIKNLKTLPHIMPHLKVYK